MADDELAALRVRLAEAEATLLAIRNGEVDAVVVAGREGPQVFTLQGTEQAYRIFIESMNEGALTLSANKMVLYANQCFARMVKSPLAQVMGSSFRRFLSADDQVAFRRLLKRVKRSGSKTQMMLHAIDGTQLPARISIRPLTDCGPDCAALCMVVTDMTDAQRNEELLRALSNRLVRAQELERCLVAAQLHDHITQPLCAILVRSQALADRLKARDEPMKREAVKLRELLAQTTEEVERIARDLRPSVLDQLGLAAVLRGIGSEFAARTGVSVRLACMKLATRLPVDVELTLYRIVQEALSNVHKHAGAHQVTVRLRRLGEVIQLAIQDDGLGFNPDRYAVERRGQGGLGLLSMRERAASAGGALTVKSAPGHGTTVQAQVPLHRGDQIHPAS